MNNKPLQSKTDSLRISCGRGGFALATMLCTVVILLIIGTGVLAVGLQSRGFAVRTSSEMVARCAADAGVTKALFEMNEKLKVIPWDGSQLPEVTGETLPNSDAIYSYAVAGDLTNGYRLKSKGQHGLRGKTINCSLSLVGLFERAILAQQDVILKAGMLVDGYNSGDPWDTDIDVQVGTMSILSDSIVLNMGVVVNGNVVVGVGGNIGSVIKDLGASTYRKYSMLEQIELPLITPPDELVDTGLDLKVHGATITVGPTDNGQYGEIELKNAVNPGILEVTGGDVILYITGDISLGQDCEIVIKDGSTLALYLDGDLDADNNAGFNNQSLPSSFKLFGTSTEGQSFILRAKSESLGAIYAPNADVIVMADSDVYGSITANNVLMMALGNFYYDEALRTVTTDDDAVRFVIREWREE
ncbi:MAG: hypothetical protein WBC22_01800 [Sedimentisphaerales bacterium]